MRVLEQTVKSNMYHWDSENKGTEATSEEITNHFLKTNETY